MSETKPAVRLRVWHRHGPEACGGVLVICRFRYTSAGEIMRPEHFEWPSGRVMGHHARMVCDSCGKPVGGEDAYEDMRAAGAVPSLSYEVGERIYDTYSGDLDDDLTLADDEP